MIPNISDGAYNSASANGYSAILAYGPSRDNSTLELAAWTSGYSAVLIGSTGVNMVYGSTATGGLSTSVNCDGTNVNVTGNLRVTNYPPTSTYPEIKFTDFNDATKTSAIWTDGSTSALNIKNESTGGFTYITTTGGGVTIDNSGFVGIKKIPTAALDVNGEIRRSSLDGSWINITDDNSSGKLINLLQSGDTGFGSKPFAFVKPLSASATLYMDIENHRIGIGNIDNAQLYTPAITLDVLDSNCSPISTYSYTNINLTPSINVNCSSPFTLTNNRFPLLQLYKKGTASLAYDQTVCFSIGGTDGSGGLYPTVLETDISYYDTTDGLYKLVRGLTLKSVSATSCNYGINNTDPQYALDVTGNIVASGTITSGSDYRIKENIKSLILEEYSVDNLNPVTFKFKEDGKYSIGLIAHELQEYYPFLVEGEKDGKKTQTVNYNGLVGVLIKEIQELKKRVKTLENKIE
jgi:hypothetical protein